MIRLTDKPSIPEEYQDIILQALRALHNHAVWILRHHYGSIPGEDLYILDNDDLLHTTLADTLAEIARAAAGQRQHDEVQDGILQEAIQEVAEAFFASPMAETYVIPSAFWREGLGQMIARARLWLRDDLITIADAARLREVSVQAIAQAVDAGRLSGFYDPDAPSRQGARLVSRAEVERL